jgi:hypothetical protein
MRAIIVLLLIITKSYSQKEPKDTLYFKLDTEYIVEKKFSKSSQRKGFVPDNYDWKMKKMEKNNSLGYFIFIRDTSYQSSIIAKPQSLREFIEKKENYYPGKYNKAINGPKLKRNFLFKYEIFFVDNQKVIKPLYLNYRSYYPIRTSRNIFIPNPNKDSLYFAFKKNDFYDPYNEKQVFKTSFGVVTGARWDGIELVIIDSVQIGNRIEAKSILEFKEHLESDRNESGIWSTEDFAEYLGNYKVFLIKDKIIYEVQPTYWTE